VDSQDYGIRLDQYEFPTTGTDESLQGN